jgi:hypothetical protein
VRYAREQKGATAAAIEATTPLTVKADDLVYAVYQLTQTPAWDEPVEVQELAASALEAGFKPNSTIPKVRADKDKIAPRILAAALAGSGITDGVAVKNIMVAVTDVNGSLGNKKLILTAAGKEAVVAQALKSVSGGPDEDAGADIAVAMGGLPFAAVGATPDAKLKTFTVAALKLVGARTG